MIFGILVQAPQCLSGQDAQLDPRLAKKINEAIDKGVVFLKKDADNVELGNKRPATWALRAWALLETGTPNNDGIVKKSAGYIRQELPEMNRVYDLALSLIFLDKLGDPADVPLIESLGVRLLAGQGNRGGWTYFVDMPNQGERTRLTQMVAEMEKLRSQGLAIKIRPRTPQETTQDILRQLGAIQNVTGSVFGGDNSNTQFAMIAVWVARRHGVPVVAKPATG